MSLRQRLLLLFAGVVIVSVALVAWTVSLRTRAAFNEMEQERTAALINQIRAEFHREGSEVGATLSRMAATDRLQNIAFSLTHGGDPSTYLQEAGSLAQEYQLDFLEIVQADGTIVSSAQWPARFGYKRQLPPATQQDAFLKNEELPDGTALGMIAVRPVHAGDAAIYLIGGKKVDREFIDSLSLPPGMYVWLYRQTTSSLDIADVIGPTVANPNSILNLVKAARTGEEKTGSVQISTAANDRATTQATPLRDDTGQIAAVLLVGASRRPLLELQQHIKAIALSIAGIGILLAIAVSLWIAARFTRPIEQLAEASREIADGNWNVQVEPGPGTELAQLAESFNTMTRQLIEQREHLVQAERVAAWRELARRLAHELKNPLFPLQITVENLVRARELAPGEFEEIFNESTSTLLAEISNLKAIIGRFSDFSKMPRPQLQNTSLNELARKVAALHGTQLKNAARPITLKLDLDDSLTEIPLDPDLFHRVVSNLVLNAVDAMSQGGTLTLRTRDTGERARLEISDTGAGLTPEERDRIFTPYYTTKQHGTGLGLAVVQSVVSDHRGTISVNSETGRGTTFIIDLPKRAEPESMGVRSGANG
ncbi:MAG: ATP-binding protein [Terriglobia bacterium]|nr:ATP-binding protein [Terriglobia bacterium]